MTISPQLLQLLVCPEDKGELLYFVGDASLPEALYNPRLKRRYSIRDGIPIMLIEEAQTLDEAEHAAFIARIS